MIMPIDSTVYRNSKGELHRDDGPAWTHPQGTEYWLQNGELHRLGGPAVVGNDGNNFWYQYGKCHRLDGPAHEMPNGNVAWYINDENVTTEVEDWLKEQKITLPMSESELSFFILTFVGQLS